MRQKNDLTHKTKKDLMVKMLREAILGGELQPGERLLQEDLAERFQVSPTPVREAIQQLIAEGILSHSPYKGVQVAEVELQDVQEVYLIRSMLEYLATREAVPNLRVSDIQKLHRIEHEIEAVVAEMDEGATEPGRLLRLNRDFHMLIYEAADLPQLLRIIKTHWIKSPWDTLFVVPQRAHMVVEEHRLILEAIDQGDAEKTGLQMRHHIERGAEALARFLKHSS